MIVHISSIKILKTFANAKECIKFMANVKDDKDVFSGEVKKELFTLHTIAAENMPIFFKKQNVIGYSLFYNDNYKSIDSSIATEENKLK
jgi:hypothetical protein